MTVTFFQHLIDNNEDREERKTDAELN